MSPPRLLDQVRDALRRGHYSRRTEEAYIGWIRRFILFHDKTHPAQMAEPDVVATSRVGITQAADLPWRYLIRETPWASRGPRPVSP